MASNLRMENCIALLRRLYPVTRLIHVGDAGKHTVSEYAEWAPKSVIFVISEDEQHQSLSSLIESHPGWSSVRAVLAESPSEREYFKASNPRESGILAPERLAGIWRNIKTLSHHRVVAQTLDSLLENFIVDAPRTNWLVVNCLPALSVLQGGGECLDECDVIVARTILDQSVSTDPASMLSSLDDYLAGRGFHRVSVQEERHPALGSAIFVRDWRGAVSERQKALDADLASAAGQAEIARTTIATLQSAGHERNARELATEVQQKEQREALIAQITSERDTQRRVASQRLSELEQAVRECGEQASLAEERQRRLEHLTLEHDRVSQELVSNLKLVSEREALVAQITADRDEQTHLANQRHKEREHALRECREQAHLAEERQRQLDELRLELDRLAEELAAELQQKTEREALVVQITADRDEQTHLANQRHRERDQAARECSENAHLAEERQRQLDEVRRGHERITRELSTELQQRAEREALIAQITSERDEQSRVVSQRSSELEQSLRECGEKASLAEERQRQLERLTLEHERVRQELAANLKLASDREALVVQITADRDEQTRLADQRYKEREQALLDRDTYIQAAHELQVRIDQLSRERNQDARHVVDAAEKAVALSLELDKRAERTHELQSELEKLRDSRDVESAELLEVRAQLERMNATAEERGAQIAKLESERDDVQARQIRLDREILKAEAQIDLIKDVILRDKAF